MSALIEAGDSFQPRHTARDRFIFARTEPESRFLGVGCGSGVECLRFASRGYHIVGIDTVFRLTGVANDWATHFDLPFQAICMDVMELGFAQGSFDGFLVEFYGHQPVLSQSLTLQRNLKQALRHGGKGLIVANRKKHASCWYRMGSRNPASMTRWLTRQSILDYRWSEHDSCEEQLRYGLYRRSHTVDSFVRELSPTFDIIKCTDGEHDPRYVVCVVERKQDPRASGEDRPDCVEPIVDHPAAGVGPVEDTLRQVQWICDFLESHEGKVIRFLDADLTKGTSPLRGVEVNLSEFIELLWEVCQKASSATPAQDT